MLPDIELMRTVDFNIKKFRKGGFIINYERAERLSNDHPERRNILSKLYEAIKQYERSKQFTATGLPDVYSLQHCSELFDEALLNGVLIHKARRGSTANSRETAEFLTGKDQSIVSPIDDFDAFISYSEGTGGHHAEIIKKYLEKNRIKAFVAHIERDRYSGNFRERVDNIIAKCRYFILLINIDTLDSDEVIEEFKKAYPRRMTREPKLVIFRQMIAPRTSDKFLTKTGVDISHENQHDFKHNEELATSVIHLCEHKDIVKVDVEVTEQTTQNLKSAAFQTDENIGENKTKAEEFKGKVAKYNLWKYSEVKGFLYRISNTVPWKVQFIQIVLAESKPNILKGINTGHLRLFHLVQRIDELYGLLDQIAVGGYITINGISGSLELVNNKVKVDSYYIGHPQTEIFGIHDPSLGLLKSGNTSAELFDNDRFLLQDLEGEFDNLRDVITNLLNLPFWDGSYSPFVAVFAPITVKFVNLDVTDKSLSVRLNCSPLVNMNGIELKLQWKDDRNRQIGGAQRKSGFRRITETEAALDTELQDTKAKFLTLKLYYYDSLIQERTYGKNPADIRWYPLN